MGRKDDALKYVDQAIALNPSDLQLIANRGVILKEIGRTEEALKVYDFVI